MKQGKIQSAIKNIKKRVKLWKKRYGSGRENDRGASLPDLNMNLI